MLTITRLHVFPFAYSTANLTVTIDSATSFTCVMSSATRALLLHAGECSLVASQPGDDRYEPVSMTFNILKKSQFIILSYFTTYTVTLGVKPFSIYAYASSGLSVTLRSVAPEICAVTEFTVTVNATGVCSMVLMIPKLRP